MTSNSKELIERIEAATGPDRELDQQIWFEDHSAKTGAVAGWSADPPHFTASLDAAMTLLDDSYVWGVSKQERNPGHDYYYQASAMPFGPIAPGEAKAATPALALCAAALRARATQSPVDETDHA